MAKSCSCSTPGYARQLRERSGERPRSSESPHYARRRINDPLRSIVPLECTARLLNVICRLRLTPARVFFSNRRGHLLSGPARFAVPLALDSTDLDGFPFSC